MNFSFIQLKIFLHFTAGFTIFVAFYISVFALKEQTLI